MHVVIGLCDISRGDQSSASLGSATSALPYGIVFLCILNDKRSGNQESSVSVIAGAHGMQFHLNATVHNSYSWVGVLSNQQQETKS